MASIDRALIAYDGSDAAKRAVAFASVLLPGAQAVIVHVFSSMPPWLALETPPVMTPPPADAQTDVSVLERHGKEIADEGAALATASGLHATSVGADAPGTSGVWSTIVQLAQEHEADLIVVGSRGHSGLRAALLGSVSNGVVHHADRPVLVVPEPSG